MTKHINTNKPFNYRLATLIIASLFAIIFSIPSFFQNKEAYPFFADKPKINLGLDLQGGLSLLLDVDVKAAVDSRYTTILTDIRFQTQREKILITRLKIDADRVSFLLLDPNKANKLEDVLKEIQGIDIERDSNQYIITLTKEEIKLIERSALEQAIGTIRNRLDRFGLAEPSVSRQGINQINVEMPGVKTLEEQQRLIDLVSKSAKLEFMAVDESLARRMSNGENITVEDAAKYDAILLPFSDDIAGSVKLPLKSLPILDGSELSDARTAADDNGNPAVSFKLNSKGAQIFGDFTSQNIHNRLAIVLDKKIFSAPTIQSKIGGGNGIISGNFTMQSANDLAITLRSGALLAPVHVVEQRSVGPSLGADSIRAAFIALVTGFILVVGFMIAYYSIAGLFASIALVINLLLIVSVMALFGATLTLPGMAGIVLTVGMAVDANIIINERIREAFRDGQSVVKSLKVGYENASRAIFDANITSLIASLLLYMYGTGSIKGFAITTSIGIIASIVTAIIGTHGVYLLLENKIDRSKLYFWFGVRNSDIALTR
ncbi:protein translocase subunit SecD [Helicobacter muridarum]|uniref:Protein translocase subunit SecD n=1 Tax=Helicobacter muridarum TaxID=216 RepID=A0A099U1U8_9HELI|nr:protein translocase subunit SecD [Helicobacter muridarum]TLE00343.1 protein translocase subunit SecD [Helicobacter muridarum]STQ85847.1 protein-export membrane protein [Helicobacter muridarum]